MCKKKKNCFQAKYFFFFNVSTFGVICCLLFNATSAFLCYIARFNVPRSRKYSNLNQSDDRQIIKRNKTARWQVSPQKDEQLQRKGISEQACQSETLTLRDNIHTEKVTGLSVDTCYRGGERAFLTHTRVVSAFFHCGNSCWKTLGGWGRRAAVVGWRNNWEKVLFNAKKKKRKDTDSVPLEAQLRWPYKQRKGCLFK